ncbi:hypothetical protein GCM10023086_69470 [Streptomyces venetus]|uniref:Uncharacterized protein n=1 Tax=Streptomyces venetus TaxID=1701086 RepID=A0ABP8H9M2_9ACTN
MGGPVGRMHQIGVGGAVLGGDVDSGSLYGGHGWAASLWGVGAEPVRVTGRITVIVARAFRGRVARPWEPVFP